MRWTRSRFADDVLCHLRMTTAGREFTWLPSKCPFWRKSALEGLLSVMEQALAVFPLAARTWRLAIKHTAYFA